MQGTAQRHREITDTLLPQADPVFDDATGKRNTKVARKRWLRLRNVPPLDLALSASGVEWPHLGGGRKHGGMRVTHTPRTRCLPHEHTRLTRGATVHAHPSLRHGGYRLALPASRSSRAAHGAPPSSRLALIEALNRDAHHPFCYASVAGCAQSGAAVVYIRHSALALSF